MADEVEMIPVDAAEPPKADPLAASAAPKVATLKLSPMARNPAAGTATSALKPGLKLPTKPGLPSGLKLPPKPGVASGLKLPPKPGVASGLKLPTKPGLPSGLKLPTKPVIRKPGATVAATPLPKPVAPQPAAKPLAVDAQGVGKLPTVEAQAVDRASTAPAAAETPTPLEALKTVTQKLKGITQEIPQQAILHKTGIIADGTMTDAQKEAAKNRTVRISLSDAMGVAPVKTENAPMKTIRIKRPVDIPGATKSEAPAPAAPASEAAAPAAPAPEAAAPAAASTEVAELPPATTPQPAASAPAPTITQRKTLKIARPGGAVRPAGKFGVKRPGQLTTAAKPSAAGGAKPEAAAPAGEAPVADIPDIPEMPAAPVPRAAAPVGADVPNWLVTMSTLFQLAACSVIGALAWFLYENAQLPTYCGGLGWQ